MISALALELSSLADKSNQIADQQNALVVLKGAVEQLQKQSTGMAHIRSSVIFTPEERLPIYH